MSFFQKIFGTFQKTGASDDKSSNHNPSKKEGNTKDWTQLKKTYSNTTDTSSSKNTPQKKYPSQGGFINGSLYTPPKKNNQKMSPLMLKIKVSEKIYQKLKEMTPESHPNTFFYFTEMKEKWENLDTQPNETDFIQLLCHIEELIDRLIQEIPQNQSFVEEINYFSDELISLGAHCFSSDLEKKFRFELENRANKSHEIVIL